MLHVIGDRNKLAKCNTVISHVWKLNYANLETYLKHNYTAQWHIAMIMHSSEIMQDNAPENQVFNIHGV